MLAKFVSTWTREREFPNGEWRAGGPFDFFRRERKNFFSPSLAIVCRQSAPLRRLLSREIAKIIFFLCFLF
jgi:hypothetical protein